MKQSAVDYTECIITLHQKSKDDTQRMKRIELGAFFVEGFYLVGDVAIFLRTFLETGPRNL